MQYLYCTYLYLVRHDAATYLMSQNLQNHHYSIEMYENPLWHINFIFWHCQRKNWYCTFSVVFPHQVVYLCCSLHLWSPIVSISYTLYTCIAYTLTHTAHFLPNQDRLVLSCGFDISYHSHGCHHFVMPFWLNMSHLGPVMKARYIWCVDGVTKCLIALVPIVHLMQEDSNCIMHIKRIRTSHTPNSLLQRS